MLHGNRTRAAWQPCWPARTEAEQRFFEKPSPQAPGSWRSRRIGLEVRLRVAIVSASDQQAAG